MNTANFDKDFNLTELKSNALSGNSEQVYELYKVISLLTFEELKSVFPAEKAIIEQNIYDYSTEIFKSKNNDDAVFNFAKGFISSAFSNKNLKKMNHQNFYDDLQLLQKLFFFLFREIAKDIPDFDDSIFTNLLTQQDWYSADNLSMIFNKLIQGCNFNNKKQIQFLDFENYKGIHFEQNEGFLRLLYNFTRPASAAKEGIINELNFVREEQKAILPVWPNTRKDNYKQVEADNEIKKVRKNLNTLKNIDFGFRDKGFSQTFLMNDEDRSSTFSRHIWCKCFQETEMTFSSIRRSRGKIFAKREERRLIKSSLTTKYLYPERNKVTHVGENFAVFTLFTKDYKDKDKGLWEELVLQSLWDAKKYLENFYDKKISKSLMQILNYFFEKIVSDLNLKYENISELWNQVFINGNLNIEYNDYKKTNLFNQLNSREVLYFKKFMSFLYCSENTTDDFIIRNKTKIQLYLIYLSLEINKNDQ